MKPQQFTKRPIAVEAWRVPAELDRLADLSIIPAELDRLADLSIIPAELAALLEWCGGQLAHEKGIEGGDVLLLEGMPPARSGDWIAKDVAGNFYPIPADVFAATYDRVAEPAIAHHVASHIIDNASAELAIFAIDAPGAGGARHEYAITWPGCARPVRISFQNGPIAENGVNGLTQEALLAVVIDRLKAFQAGPFACRENALALTKAEEAMLWLHSRTRERQRRGVEGKSQA